MPRTASAAYTERANTIGEQMCELTKRLIAHSDRQAQNPKDWGFTGDLGHISELLGEILAFLPETK